MSESWRFRALILQAFLFGLNDAASIKFHSNGDEAFISLDAGSNPIRLQSSVDFSAPNIQKMAGDITALASSIPTQVSALSNDAGYITSSSLPSKLSQLTNDQGYITSSSVPSKLSQLTNDPGFITSNCGEVSFRKWGCREYYDKPISACNYEVCTARCGCSGANSGGTQMLFATPGY